MSQTGIVSKLVLIFVMLQAPSIHPILFFQLASCDPLKGKFLQQHQTVHVRLDVGRLESSL